MAYGNKQHNMKLSNHNLNNRKDSDLVPKMTNSFMNKGLSVMSAKNKYYKQHLPSLPIAQMGMGKKTYKCSEASSEGYGKVMAYGLHSTNGAVRPYNEDRVVEFHTNLTDDNGATLKFTFFGVYDGHGGSQCSKYLAKELHMMIVDDPDILKNPVVTIRKHIFEIDNKFLKLYHDNPTSAEYQRAGSCLNIIIIIEDMLYLANVGDCRSIMSTEGGRVIYQLSKDHKPCDPHERDRVIDAGGKIYVSSIKQTQGTAGLSLQRTDKLITKNDTMPGSTEDAMNVIENGGEAFGPHRVIPGRLSVSRAIGDAHAKVKQLGGNDGVVIPRPDIKKFKLLETYDFIIMGSDGLFDKQSNSDIIKFIYKTALELYENETKNINRISIMLCEKLVREAIDKKTLDNISCNIIIFENFINALNGNVVTMFNGAASKDKLHSMDISFTPKKTLPPLGKHKIVMESNFDLTDNDIDKKHSSKPIEYLLNSAKKINIASESERFNHRSQKSSLYPTEAIANTTPSKVVDQLKYSYRLPAVTEKPKMPYSESFSNSNGIQSLNSNYANHDKPQTYKPSPIKARHHTQPRMLNKPFGITNDFSPKKKSIKMNPYVNSLQSRVKSGDHNKIYGNTEILRRENPNQINSPSEKGDGNFQKRRSSKSKRSPYKFSTNGAQIATSVLPTQNKANIIGDRFGSSSRAATKIQLQGHTIQPDSKYTSLAEVHQRGFLPKNSYGKPKLFSDSGR